MFNHEAFRRLLYWQKRVYRYYQIRVMAELGQHLAGRSPLFLSKQRSACIVHKKKPEIYDSHGEALDRPIFQKQYRPDAPCICGRGEKESPIYTRKPLLEPLWNPLHMPPDDLFGLRK